MIESEALTELRDVIARKEFIIRHSLVIRAIHDMFDVSLEAAEGIEALLREAGYEQSKRGDWALFD